MKFGHHTSKRRRCLAASIIISGASLIAPAQINSPGADGYMARGLEMFAQGNYNGCIDQLTAIDPASLSPDRKETLDWTLAMAAYHTSGPASINHFKKFLASYPASILRQQARLRIADCILASNYAEALKAYNDIDPDALPADLREELAYHKALCYLNLADFQTAASLFGSLTHTSRYGNAARFYIAYIAYVNGDYDRALQGFTATDGSVAPSDMAPYYMAQIYYLRGDWARALDMARKLLARKDVSPSFSAEANRLVGECLYILGDTPDAIPYLEKYTASTDTPLRSALYILGKARYDDFRYDEAVKTLRPVTAADDAMAQSAYLYIGQALLKTGDNDAALMAFDKALRMNHDRNVREAAFYNFAVAKFAGGSAPFAGSAATFEEFLKIFPESSHAAEVQDYIIAGYMADRNLEGALESISRMKRPSAKALRAKQQILYNLGARALRNGNLETAADYLSRAASLSDKDPETARQTNLLLGETFYRTGHFDKAADKLLAYIRSAAPSDVNLPMARYDLGYVRFSQKKYDDAATNFNIVLDLINRIPASDLNLPNAKADIYNRLGDIAYYASDFKTASDHYGTALGLNPDAGDYPMFQQALMQGYSRDFRSKINTLTEMKRKFPSSALLPEALLEITEAKIQLGDNNGAIDTYKELIASYPSTAQARQAYLQMALTELNTGHRDRAEAAYKKLISLHPSSDEAAEASIAMQRLAAEDGTITQFIAFLESVPGAPRVDIAQVDRLTFEAAEKAYLEDGLTSRLTQYTRDYPEGAYTSRAIEYLLGDAIENHLDTQAYDLASTLVARYPDRNSAIQALEVMARHESAAGNHTAARQNWQRLTQTASDPDTRVMALEGLLLSTVALADNPAVISTADALLATSSIDEPARLNATAAKADALAATGNIPEAVALWKSIASVTDDINGVRSAYRYAQSLFDDGNISAAKTETEKIVNSGTPHAFWLAKAFILLSDIYMAGGNNFEAGEYLRALRENYPGNEPEIIDAIDSRLSTLDPTR